MKILIVEDERQLSDVLVTLLKQNQHSVDAVYNGIDGEDYALTGVYDAIILDIMLPDFDGLEVMRRIRTTQPNVPVIFLTARDALVDRIAGLTAGGDDYVTKPFSLEELIARVRALLRRSGMTSSVRESILSVGDLNLNEDSHEVSRAGAPISLTATEFELLRFLMRNPNRVVSKTQILDRVWHYDFGGQVNVVELYVSYLRKKIDAGRRPMIHTLRGAGYLLKAAEV